MREGQLRALKVRAFLSSGEIRDWTLGKTSSQSDWDQEQAAQGGGGVPILEVFKRNGDVVLRGMVSGGLGSIRLMVGHGDLKGLF